MADRKTGRLILYWQPFINRNGELAQQLMDDAGDEAGDEVEDCVESMIIYDDKEGGGEPVRLVPLLAVEITAKQKIGRIFTDAVSNDVRSRMLQMAVSAKDGMAPFIPVGGVIDFGLEYPRFAFPGWDPEVNRRPANLDDVPSIRQLAYSNEPEPELAAERVEGDVGGDMVLPEDIVQAP